MLSEHIRQEAKQLLDNHYKQAVNIENSQPVGGGSINEAWKLKTSQGDIFLKHNSAGKYPGMFEREANGLQLMRDSKSIPVPEVIGTGQAQDDAFIVMEFLNPAKRKNGFWKEFAENLAGMHKTTNDEFGLDHDNYMGSLQQYNKFHELWYDFFILERLEPQLRLARNEGKMNKNHVIKFEQLYKELQSIVPEEKPALVHGDLYSGNFVVNKAGQAAILDPAVAFNHREVDIAMSTLFGVFDQQFYEAYHQHFPMEKGWQDRLDIYNLYPLLIHVNLFGMGYLSSVERIIRSF